MTVNLNDLLSIILFICLIILVVVLVIFVIKLIKTMKKVNVILDNVEVKANQLNGAFTIVDNVTGAINGVSSKVTNFIYDKVNKLVDKKGNEEDE